jgi:hypothetical protein
MTDMNKAAASLGNSQGGGLEQAVVAVATPATVAAVAPSSDAATLQMLVGLLLAERQEAMEDRKVRALAILEKDKQRQINAEYNRKEKLQSQEICTHKKGVRGIKSPKVDYAISFHTFVSADSYIRCLICGMKWKNTDTPEYLVRRGKKVPNHTGLGWKDAYRMLGESSNTATSSEVQLNTRPIIYEAPNFEENPRAVEI